MYSATTLQHSGPRPSPELALLDCPQQTTDFGSVWVSARGHDGFNLPICRESAQLMAAGAVSTVENARDRFYIV